MGIILSSNNVSPRTSSYGDKLFRDTGIPWLHAIGCSPPSFATHTTFSARSSPLRSPDIPWPPQASASVYPTIKRRQAMYSPCPIEPCFLLFSPRFYFPSRFFSIHVPYILSTTISSISLSLHLELLAPVNSCELHVILY